MTNSSIIIKVSDGLFFKIRAELVYHNIVRYPFDSDEYDDEELRLNERIRVYIFE